MAVILKFHAPGMTWENYEALRPLVRWEENYPKGALLHAAGVDEAGEVHVVDVWNSKEEVQEFFQTRLGPAFAQLGINPPPPQVIEAKNIDAFPGIEAHTP